MWERERVRCACIHIYIYNTYIYVYIGFSSLCSLILQYIQIMASSLAFTLASMLCDIDVADAIVETREYGTEREKSESESF